MFKSYNPNRQLRLVRNPHFKEWSKAAQPAGYPDEITYSFGLTVEAQITAIQNGQADWTLEAPPADRLPELEHEVREPGAHLAADGVLVPADEHESGAVQQAQGAASRELRDRPQRRHQDLRRPAASPRRPARCCHPDFPGYKPYCPYTKNPGTKWTAPDVAKAKQLVKESGTSGQRVAVVVPDDEVNKAMGVYVQSVLNDIGYRATVKTISGNIFFTYVQNTKNKVQINVQQWYQDYPAASDFLYILFGCESFHPGSDSSINIAGFCDRKINARMKAALALGVEDEAAANVRWTQIDRAVTNASPMVTMFNPKHVDFVSKRVGNFTFSKQFYWLVDQSWVK